MLLFSLFIHNRRTRENTMTDTSLAFLMKIQTPIHHAMKAFSIHHAKKIYFMDEFKILILSILSFIK